MKVQKPLKRVEIDLHNPAIRKKLRRGFLTWCLLYLPHYFYLPPADFHPELIKNLSDDKIEMLLILGFRGSAKSVIASLAFVLYCALEHKYDFILPVFDTSTQMELALANIKSELESNAMIINDYGIMFNAQKNWSGKSLLLNNNVLILGRTRGQKIRGLRHGIYRPQLVIVDDAEDTDWVKTKKNREKTEQWFNSEVVPAQQETEFKLIVIGNLLHKNALMYRLRDKKRTDGTPLFKFMEFALIDPNTGKCTWKGKYPNDEAIQKQKEKIGSETAWAREYLLKIISDKDAVVKERDIHFYDPAILATVKKLDAGVGNDLAISEEQTADFTAFVCGYKVKIGNKTHILILPKPVNEHLDFDATKNKAVEIDKKMPAGTKFFMEDVQYQKSALQTLKKHHGIAVVSMRPISDKKARLETASTWIKDYKEVDGKEELPTVLFPSHGCEILIEQLLGFGTEEHDDLVDALVYLILGLMNTAKGVVIGKGDQM